ncbi:MAG: cation-translocating P-type ATPase [Bacillota bacterium]
MADWHALEAEEVLAVFGANAAQGLSEREAAERLARFGPNELLKATRASLVSMFLGQFRDFMVILLLAATLISFFLGEYADALAILAIVTLNAVLGCIHEFKAERSLEALKQLVAPEARVMRNGLEKKIPAAELVPGDLVFLEAGDRVPADLRLLQARNLETNEASLTGEAAPVKKDPAPLRHPVSPGETRNMAYLGTVVTRGRGQGVVVATGMATEMGRIAGLIQEAQDDQTPLQRRLAHLGKALVGLCLLICALVVALGIYRGEGIYQMFLAGVSLAVAAIPEGLPAIVTVALATGVQRMARRRAIVRKLSAVETLGCATVICADKTGTLTQNQMTVRKILAGGKTAQVTGEGYDPKGEFTGINVHDPALQLFLKIAALCNNAVLTRGEISVGGMFRNVLRKRPARAWGVHGDPTEGALLVMAAKGGVWREEIEKQERRVAEFPFDSDRKRMTVVYRRPDGRLAAYVKGAPDVVLELCTHYLDGERVLPLPPRKKEEFLRANGELAARALRVLVLAYRELPAAPAGANFLKGPDSLNEQEVEKNLIFAGLAGMLDPPRPAARTAVQKCRRAGIKVVMITGDHRLTAGAVAGELGLLERESAVLTGPELDALDDAQLRAKTKNTSVFARVAPRHKLRIVRALKENGHVVAMTGDGVNDAPAVKEADIGIAMGIAGTDVTKEAAAMVLADDNFNTIVAAVEEGRGIYENIRKTIRYLLSCNIGEVLVMFLAVLAGLPLPLLPVQILWMNLITDGLPAMALGVEPVPRDVMYRRPRDPRESIFAHGLGWRIFGGGLLIGLTAMALFAAAYQGEPARLAESRTVAFNALVFLQLFYVLVCRSERPAGGERGFWANPCLPAAVFFSAFLQVAVTQLPLLQPVFRTVSLDWRQWGMILGAAGLPFLSNLFYSRLKLRAAEKIVYLKV